MNEKIEKLLLYVGTAGAAISAIAYLIIMIVLVIGIQVRMETSQLLVVSIAGGLAGLMITNMLRTQGVALAANTEESKVVMNDYHRAINKTKSVRTLRTIKFHMVKELITDILTKVLTIAASTYFMASIFMEGNGDFSLIGLALSNILMFISFGILALRKAYKYYGEEHLAAIRELTNRLKEESKPIIRGGQTGQVGDDFHRYQNDPDGTYGVMKRGDLEEMKAHVEKLKNKNDEVASVPLEEINDGELRECEIPNITTTSGEE